MGLYQTCHNLVWQRGMQAVANKVDIVYLGVSQAASSSPQRQNPPEPVTAPIERSGILSACFPKHRDAKQNRTPRSI